MERFSKFCRTLIPVDPFQALFLFGVVLISFSRQLGWYSRPLILEYERSTIGLTRFSNFMILAVLPIVFAGCSGYFVCFWPGKHAVRRTVVALILPALAGLALVFFNYVSLIPSSDSILYHEKSYFSRVARIVSDWKLLPTAFFACLFGVLLVLVFLQRLVVRKSVLPVGFPISSEEDDSLELPKRISILIFAIPALVFFTACTSNVLAFLSRSNVPSQVSDSLFKFSGAIQSLFLFFAALLIVGSAALKPIRGVLQLTTASFFGWTLVIGVVLGFLIPTLRYLYERSHWATFGFGKFDPPRFSDFLFSNASWESAVGLVVVAICEEIVLRGLLQPSLINRFGMHRGIIFTAAIWGAYRFHLYSFARYSVPDLLLIVGTFFGAYLVLSYIYAWASLQSRSLIPAIVLHAILNLSTLVGTDREFPGAKYARLAIWTLGTLALFRFWPISGHRRYPAAVPEPDPSPSV